MRILHTSDWHVGKTIRGESRAAEHTAVLAEIAQIARDEAVDVVIVAGDLFETAAPTPEAEQIVYRALLDLRETGATVVAVSGNHDNDRRLTAVRPLLGLGRIVSLASVARPEEGGVVEIEAGGRTAKVALVPFLSQRHVVKADDLMNPDKDGGEHSQAYAARVQRIIGTLCEEFGPDTVNIVVAHLMVAGGTLGGGERDAHTIFEYYVQPQAFPGNAHYVALGHLHRSQRIAGPCPIYYCGSPLQLDFGETEDRKSVLIVDAEPGAPAEVREVFLRSGRRLRNLRGTLEDLRALAGTTGDDYLRVFVKEKARAGLADEVRELFDNAMHVVVDTPESDDERIKRPSREGRHPRELFADYLEERGVEDPRLNALFDELYEEAHAPDPA